MAWGDYDNDGFLDVIITFADFSPTRLYRNNGNGTFTDTGIIFAGRAFAWGDYDNDGSLDLAGLIQSNVYIYHNNANGTFTLAAMFTDLSGANDGPFLWGDFDNDGDLDLLGPYPNIFRNDGGGHFSEVRAAFATLQGAKGDWGDFDNDGQLKPILRSSTQITGMGALPRVLSTYQG